MKQLKKLAGVLLSIAVCAVMIFTAVPAMAEGTTSSGTTSTGNSLTINNTGNTVHTFELYQIFTGDYSNGTLSNIKWGNGVSSDGQAKLGDAATKAGNIKDATTFANEVKQYLTNPTTSTSVAAGSSYTFDNLAAGYYLVKDVDKSQKDTAGAYTSYIVQVVGKVTQDTKLDVPTVVKKVKDTNDSTGVTTDWQDSADYDIGDTIPYQITGTMPSNIDKYTTYKYAFTDTMSKGLTYTAKTATIKIGDTDVTSSFTEAVISNIDGSTTVTWC
jgi:fimbrial isopeptide formation D2 family protein